ncbi:MAG TPA: alpha-amylase domain-containing protein, partial [Chitinophagaceae bacterium]|nr:alpha-amylase domain-containing protein [Chitinophagaceae bacterium]
LSGDVNKLLQWYHAVGDHVQLFDMVLHHNFYEASLEDKYDMTKILDNTLISHLPHRAISFVDNHDTQPGQLLASFIEWWFKPLANAIILLREQGIPCLFYPSLYGANYDEEKDGKNYRVELAPVPALREMMMARHHLAYGQQRDYFDHPNVVGWTRAGDEEHKLSGLAVLLSNGDEGFKKMEMGPAHANATFIDITGNRGEKVQTDENGFADFLCQSRSASVWIRSEMEEVIKM